jgi:mRNA-degrading endonuclease RelE of RelBE toxin-antitoxin system
LARLDPPEQKRVIAAVDRFAESGQGDVRPLQGELQGRYRLRVGDRRVVFTCNVDAGVISVLRVAARGDVYK